VPVEVSHTSATLDLGGDRLSGGPPASTDTVTTFDVTLPRSTQSTRALPSTRSKRKGKTGKIVQPKPKTRAKT